jgi:hypothetical protein
MEKQVSFEISMPASQSAEFESLVKQEFLRATNSRLEVKRVYEAKGQLLDANLQKLVFDFAFNHADSLVIILLTVLKHHPEFYGKMKELSAKVVPGQEVISINLQRIKEKRYYKEIRDILKGIFFGNPPSLKNGIVD